MQVLSVFSQLENKAFKIFYIVCVIVVNCNVCIAIFRANILAAPVFMLDKG